MLAYNIWGPRSQSYEKKRDLRKELLPRATQRRDLRRPNSESRQSKGSAIDGSRCGARNERQRKEEIQKRDQRAALYIYFEPTAGVVRSELLYIHFSIYIDFRRNITKRRKESDLEGARGSG